MYQLIVALLQPYTFLLMSLLALLWWSWRNERPRRPSTSIAMCLLILLWLLSTPAIGHLAVGSLEWTYPPSTAAPSRNDTIVVLAGNMSVDNKEGTKVRIGGVTLFRCLHAFQLYEQSEGCHIVVSGGKLDPSKPGMTVAEAMRDFLILLGVPPSDLILENESTTTFDNARYTCELLREEHGQRIFLVTSAFHMRRAVGCFARQGQVVVPAPCNHQALRLELSPMIIVPSADGIRGVQAALHEWLGLAWYRMRGRI